MYFMFLKFYFMYFMFMLISLIFFLAICDGGNFLCHKLYLLEQERMKKRKFALNTRCKCLLLIFFFIPLLFFSLKDLFVLGFFSSYFTKRNKEYGRKLFSFKVPFYVRDIYTYILLESNFVYVTFFCCFGCFKRN